MFFRRPASLGCRSRVWVFPTSILQCKIKNKQMYTRLHCFPRLLLAPEMFPGCWSTPRHRRPLPWIVCSTWAAIRLVPAPWILIRISDRSPYSWMESPTNFSGSIRRALGPEVTIPMAEHCKQENRPAVLLRQSGFLLYGLEGSRTLDLSDANRTLIPTEVRDLHCPLITEARGHRSF